MSGLVTELAGLCLIGGGVAPVSAGFHLVVASVNAAAVLSGSILARTGRVDLALIGRSSAYPDRPKNPPTVMPGLLPQAESRVRPHIGLPGLLAF